MKKSQKINIFTTFSDAEESNAQKAANQSPLDRIKETVNLILRVYPINENNSNNHRIYFDRE